MMDLPENSNYRVGPRQFYVSHEIEFKGLIPFQARLNAVWFGVKVVWHALFGRIMDIHCHTWENKKA